MKPRTGPPLSLVSRAFDLLDWLNVKMELAMVEPKRRAQRFVDRLNAVHLEWALREMHPLHPEIPEIVRELADIARRSTC